MEIETNRGLKPLIPRRNEGISTASNTDLEGLLKAKTSLRMVYEAQTLVIQKQIGDLESVRVRLGLSARKICQLLMVDPSAWNRWTRPGASAPPHIWRALQWYMIVQEKLPGLTPQFFIERVVTKVEKTVEKTVERIVEIPTENPGFSSISETQAAWAENLGAETQRLNVDLGDLRAQSQTLLSQIEEQNALLKTQTEQIARLKFALVVGLCLCFGIVIGLLTYQLKRASQPAWESQPAGQIYSQ